MSLQTARIRLEGQLEVLEHSTAAFQSASASMVARRPRGLTSVVERDAEPEVLDAEAAVRRLVSNEPELRGVLEGLEAARTAFWAQVRAHAQTLKAPLIRPQAVVTMLESETVRFDRRLRGTAVFFLWGPLAAISVAMMAVTVGLEGLVLPALFVNVIVCLSVADAARVVVTGSRISVNDQTFSFEGLRSIHVRNRQTLPIPFLHQVEVDFERKDGRVTTVELPSFPRALRSSLEASKVRVGVDWWFGDLR
jgi:hypothetical protein